MIGVATVVAGAIALALARTDVVSIEHLADYVITEEVYSLPLPDRPSLVVLPFKNIGPGTEQEYFADGITEDVITDLSRVAGIFVIARNSSFAYKSRPQNVRKVGRELGVRYVVGGSVRRFEGTMRIAVQLTDATNGGQVWATRFDRPVGDIFKIQDEITGKIVDALALNIKEGRQTQVIGAQTKSIEAYDAYLRGWAAYRRNTLPDYQEAIKFFQAAISLDPGFAQAHAATAATYLAMRKYAWIRAESLETPVQIVLDALKQGGDLLERAQDHLLVALRDPSSLAYRSSAEISIFKRRHDDALEDIRKAIALDPNDADNLATLGSIFVWSGTPDDAIEPIERAMRLNPFHPPLYLCHYGSALFSLGRYADAEKKLEECRAGNPENLWPYIYLIATYAYLGNDAAAAASLDHATQLLKSQNRSLFTVKEVRNRMRYRYRADLLRLLVGLHKAGVPNTMF